MSAPKATKNKIIVILGPTASGKSALAVKIAKRFNGEIISADSRQVYKGLDMGSGKITKKEMKGIPHYLLDVASPKRVFTVSQFQKLAKQAIEKIVRQGNVPILCGGTGLYIDSVIYDLKIPEVPPNPKLRTNLEKLSTEDLFEKLKKLDPRRADSIDKHNRRRLIRALEIVILTKKPVPLSTTPKCSKQYNPLIIGIKKSPEELNKNIRKRLYGRLKIGMIKEVKNLHKPFNPARERYGLSWKRLDDLGLEYRFISRYLRGFISKKEMEDLIQKESEKYAKRQMTWFKRSPQTHWIEKEKEALPIIKTFLENSDKK